MSKKTLSAALELAATGVPAFPCLANKHPATPHGFKDATADPDKLQWLWAEYPGELVGVPTGNTSGIDVLDLDAKHVEAIAWMKENRRRFPQTRKHRTRSGGAHLLFQHDDAMTCTVAKIALGVDTRANGGYVIWWPAAGLPIISDAPPAPWCVNAAAKMHRLAGAKIHQRCWRAGPRTGGLRQTSDLGGIIRRCVRAGTRNGCWRNSGRSRDRHRLSCMSRITVSSTSSSPWWRTPPRASAII